MQNQNLTHQKRAAIVLALVESSLANNNDASIDTFCKQQKLCSKTLQIQIGEAKYRELLERKKELRKQNYLKRIADIFTDFKNRIDSGEKVNLKDFCKRYNVSYSSLRKETPFDEMTAYLLKMNPSARVRKVRKPVKKRTSKYFVMPPREEDLFIGKFLI